MAKQTSTATIKNTMFPGSDQIFLVFKIKPLNPNKITVKKCFEASIRRILILRPSWVPLIYISIN